MSILRLVEAPIKTPLLGEDGTLAKVWLQYVATLAESTAGYWGKAEKTLVIAGVTADTIDNVLLLNGAMLTVQITLTSDENATVISTGSVTIPKEYKVLNSVINLYEIESGLISTTTPIYVEDSKIKLPNLSTSNTLILTGNLIRR